MFVRTFEWATDDEYGTDGWRLKGMPHFNVGSGMTIAHDVLEHMPGKHADDLNGEFMAFGAMLYIRGEAGYWYNKGSFRGDMAEQTADEVAQFIYDNGDELRDPGRTVRLEEEHEEMFDRLRPLAIRGFHDRGSESPVSDFKRDLERAIGWMRKGYRKAVRRYHKNSAWHMMNLFMKVEQEIDERFKRGDFGELMKIAVNPRTLEHRITREYDAQWNGY